MLYINVKRFYMYRFKLATLGDTFIPKPSQGGKFSQLVKIYHETCTTMLQYLSEQ